MSAEKALAYITPTSPGGKYLYWLYGQLSPHYTKPNTITGYDMNHVEEMLFWGPKIKALTKYQNLDLDMYAAAVLLHNTDRPQSLKPVIGFVPQMLDEDFKRVWKEYLSKLLLDSPFSDDERGCIVDAVLTHMDKYDKPTDSILKTCLRAADKFVRFGPLGMMGQPANNRGNPFYNSEKPFGYGDSAEKNLVSVLGDHFRVLEWYQMLPDDELRSLIPKSWILWQREQLKRIAMQICFYHPDIPNTIDSDIQKALGHHLDPLIAY